VVGGLDSGYVFSLIEYKSGYTTAFIGRWACRKRRSRYSVVYLNKTVKDERYYLYTGTADSV
jgi:hypothetical protein